MMFDRSRLRHRPRFAGADFLHVHAAEEVVERLLFVSRTFETGLAVTPLSPGVRAALDRAGVAWTFASGAGGGDVAADVAMPFRRAFPLVVALQELHLANDPVAALGELRGVLRPDGVFLGAVLASGSLAELADALLEAEAGLTGNAAVRVAPFGDVRRWGDALAKAGFALPVVDEGRLTVRYGSLRALLEDLSAMGVRGVLSSRQPAPRRLFERAEAVYRERFADPDGRLRATFAFAHLSGWAPDPSQQRPARRGSATVRLEDALKTIGS